MKKIIIPASVLLGGIGLYLLLGSFASGPQQRQIPLTRKLVNIKKIEPGQLDAQITAYGRLVSSQPVVLTAEVAGTLLQGDIPFQPAQKFRKGQVLLRIDDRQTRYDLNSVKSDFLTSLANVLPEIKIDFPEEYPRWQAYFDRCGFEDELPPLPDAGNDRIKLFLARFNVYKLYFSSNNLQIRLSKHQIRAPFNGAIQTVNLRVGSTAAVNTRLAEIINLDAMEIEVPVPAADISWINQKSPVRLTSAEIAGEWQGKIARVGSALNSQTQTIPVYIRPQNNDGLFEGAFLRAEFRGRTVENAVAIPQSLLYEGDIVYLVQNNRLQRRKVEVARKEAEIFLINGGLQSGDSLVAEVLQGVAEGMPVQPRPVSAGGGGQ